VYRNDAARHMKFTYGLIVVFFVAILGLVAWGMIALA